MGSRAEKRSISRRTWVASLVESPVAFNDLRAPHPRRAALVRVTLSSRPSMSLNFRASSTRNTLHDADVRNTLHDDDDVDDVNSDVQVPVTLLQMSPLDDDVDNVPWSLQVRLRPTACESARWRHRVSLSVCCCVSRACSVLQLQGALSMPPSTRRPPPASWTPCVGVALTGVVCARVIFLN